MSQPAYRPRRAYALGAALLAAALVVTAAPTGNATHLAPGADVTFVVGTWTDAMHDGILLGQVTPEFTGPVVLHSTAYNMRFTNITPSAGVVRVELISPSGAIVGVADLTTGHNATTRNATFIITPSTMPAAGIYSVREVPGGLIVGAVYVQPWVATVSVSPNPVTYSGNPYILTYNVLSGGVGLANATLTGPGLSPNATTGPDGSYTALHSTPGVGTHAVQTRKQTWPQQTNGYDVPEHAGNGTYTVVAATPKVKIGNVSGSILHAVSAPIHIENLTDLGSATVRLTFDPAVVEVLGVGNSSVPGATLTSNVDQPNGTVTILLTTSARPGPSGSFVLATLSMRAVGSAGATSPLDLTVDELVDSDGDAISATVVDGTFRAGLLGDADGDGDVDLQDVQAIADAVVGNRPMSSIVAVDADVSRDGVVTGKDAMFLGQHLAGTRPFL